MLRALGILLTFFFVRWLFSLGKDHEPESTDEGIIFRCPRMTQIVILICSAGLTSWGVYLAMAERDFWFAGFLVLLGVLPWGLFPRKIVISSSGIQRSGLWRDFKIQWSEVAD